MLISTLPPLFFPLPPSPSLPLSPSLSLPLSLPLSPSLPLPPSPSPLPPSLSPSLPLSPSLCSYFKQGQLFGLSCFEKMPVQSEQERGVRMKSVGLLAVGYVDLHQHQQFLQRQARSATLCLPELTTLSSQVVVYNLRTFSSWLIVSETFMSRLVPAARVQLETPGSYGSLQEYFTHYQSPRVRQSVPRPLQNGTGTEQLPTTEVIITLSIHIQHHLMRSILCPSSISLSTVIHPPPPPLSLSQVAHPAGAITQYLQFFGPHIFILWKLALLKKRVIFYAPPPIGVVCYRGETFISLISLTLMHTHIHTHTLTHTHTHTQYTARVY